MAGKESILKAMNLPAVDLRDINDVPTTDKPPKCVLCKGSGKNKQAIGVGVICSDCRGTGYDLSDPTHVIFWMANCLTFAKTTIQNQRVLLNRQSTEQAIGAFYKPIKRKD